MTKVFISYSHDSEQHRQFVLELSDQLREDGIDCWIDQYENQAPTEGWQRWMESNIEAADFVLLMCTPQYLQRFRGEDVNGGRGVNFEGVIINQILYDEFQKNAKFIPLIPDTGEISHVPLMLKSSSTYRITAQYEDLYRVLTDQPKAVARPLGAQKHYPVENLQKTSEQDIVHSIVIDKLPDVPGQFIGREAELQILNDTLQPDNHTRILQFIASGGTGKTKLLRHWLNDHGEQFPNRIIWSFYSQGTTEAKQVSLSPLINTSLEAFGYDPNNYPNDEARIKHFTDLILSTPCLLVLDGLEPMQHLEGMLKDKALLGILKTLLNHNSQSHRILSRCIITSRISVYELKDQYGDKVISHDLNNLAENDAVQLLQNLGVKGKPEHIKAAAHDYGCHALSIHLLGKVIAMRYQGDIQKRDLFKALPINPKGPRDNRHAFKVMQEYEDWFKDQPELSLLYLMGLFDQPIETEVLEHLLKANIPDLTKDLQPDHFHEALYRLQTEYKILAQHPEKQHLIDCHPLIREYFGQRLKEHYPTAWQQAHQTLYEFYQAIPKDEQPDTVDEMRPLFHAVAHGCAAGLHQQALEEVYYPRIMRSSENYLCRRHGAYSDALAVVAHFFEQPWHQPAAGLKPGWQALVLNCAGFSLRALGRLCEALQPMRASDEMLVAQKNWVSAATTASILSELQLTLGDIDQAVANGATSVDYAERSEDLFERMARRTTHADALHQAGRHIEALALFEAAERLQAERQPRYPRLYSLWDFRYCELLLEPAMSEPLTVTQARTGATGIKAVLERAQQTLEWIVRNNMSLLTIALDQLTLARAHLQQRDLQQAADWLQQAVEGLRAAGAQDHLPRGLLTRAALYRLKDEFNEAQQDLQEVYDLAEPSGMRLHLTDYHLESARLGFAVVAAQAIAAEAAPAAGGDVGAASAAKKSLSDYLHGMTIQQHIEAAEQLINDTGYHRRDAELLALKTEIKTIP